MCTMNRQKESLVCGGTIIRTAWTVTRFSLGCHMEIVSICNPDCTDV